MAVKKDLKYIEKSIYKSDSGLYRVRVQDRYKRWYPVRSFSKLFDARAYRDQLLAQRARLEDAVPSKLRNLTIEDYHVMWAEKCRPNLSEGWRITQDKMAQRHLLPLLGKIRLAELKSANVGDLMLHLESKGLGGQSRLHIHNLIRKMCEDAVHEFEILDRNPVTKKYKPKVYPKERPYLKPEEVLKLLKVAQGHRIGPAVWLACLCGLRSEAIIALRWESVTIDDPGGRFFILVKDAFKRKTGKIESPKGKRPEYVPVPPLFAEYLKKVRGDAKADDFVCRSATGGMLPYRSLYFKVRELCRLAGVTEVGTHALRHSATELYVIQGANLEDIRRFLHHRSPITTLRYIHRTDDRLHDLAEKVSCALPQDLLKPNFRVVK